MWALGVTGTYLGDYFGILMDVPFAPTMPTIWTVLIRESVGEGRELPVQRYG